MYRLLAVLMLAVASPALAQTPPNTSSLSDCTAIGKTASGETVYGLDCKALKAEINSPEYKPGMAPTALKDSVIPKAGATQTPETTPTSGVNK